MQNTRKLICLSLILEKLKGSELLVQEQTISSKNFRVLVTYPITDTRAFDYQNYSIESEPSYIMSFICIKGTSYDGHKFVDKAVSYGVKLFFVEHKQKIADSVLQIVVKDTRKTLAILASLYFENPSANLFLIGVTGTNGKTSIVKIIESILLNANLAVGSIGTLGYSINGKHYNMERTTPDITDLHLILSEMLRNNIHYVVMEVSSHSLKLDRVYGLMFDMAIFTNLSREHLDFHADMEDYFLNKKKLFDYLKANNGTALINIDNPYGDRLYNEFSGKKFSISANNNADIRYLIQLSDLKKTSFDIEFGQNYTKQYLDEDDHSLWHIETPLLGTHNAFNITAAIAAVRSVTQVKSDDVIDSIPETIPGRLQRVTNSHNIKCFIDYAHTPEALEMVCKTIADSHKRLQRKEVEYQKSGRFICVIGAGGDRDKGKRKDMTESAFRYADMVIVTSDNPRKENPSDIITDMVEHLDPMSNYWIAVDRKQAIDIAISLATPDDVILIAGKGHEKYQELSQGRIPFDDYQTAQNTISNKLKESVDIRHTGIAPASSTIVSNNSESKISSSATVSTAIPIELLQIRLLLENREKLDEDFFWGREKDQSVYRKCNDYERVERLRNNGLTEDQQLFTAISTDTRTIVDQSIFVALKGENFDGHNYVASALKNRSNWAIVDKSFQTLPNPEDNSRLIRVDDTYKAYALLAKKYRNLFNIPFIVITGSSGKTTTKEYCYNILSVSSRVLKNIANENNILGVSKTLLRLDPSYKYAVIEIGSNHFGEIELLANICQPDIGLLTNIGPSHLEFFQDLEGVFREKTALLERDLDWGIVPGDDTHFDVFAGKYIRIALNRDRDERVVDYHIVVSSNTQNQSLFRIGDETYSIPSDVKFNVLNAGFAILLAKKFGYEKDTIQAGLNTPLKIKNRMEIYSSNGKIIISDCYNANPATMKEAIDYWLKSEPEMPHVAILGDMLELGQKSINYHREIGDYLKQKCSDTSSQVKIITVGNEAKYFSEPDYRLEHFANVGELLESHILNELADKVVILLKGSHGIHLEKIKGRL